MSDVIDNSKVSSIEKYDNRIRVSNYDLTRCGNERYSDLCGENPEYPEVTRFTETANSHKGIDIVNGTL